MEHGRREHGVGPAPGDRLGGFPEMNAVYAEAFGDVPPARATIGVAALPAGAQVEIEAVAVIGAGR
jgi:enamine deaminase RidA (YjgF/YER057c/UK114 family)